MKLIISDRTLDLTGIPANIEWIDLSALQIANCIGCFGCWTKTPGKCVIRDDAVSVYPRIAASDRLMYISKVKYGGYDSVMKTMLERAIPIQRAFIRLHQGETHHLQRAVVPKRASVIAYGEISEKEKAVFRLLVARNAKNMNFESYKVMFAAENQLEQMVRTEVRTRGKSESSMAARGRPDRIPNNLQRCSSRHVRWKRSVWLSVKPIIYNCARP